MVTQVIPRHVKLYQKHKKIDSGQPAQVAGSIILADVLNSIFT